jgi:GTP-binding protein
MTSGEQGKKRNTTDIIKMNDRPLIAIVGRPNVGKSMLFNKIVGQRLSIVEDTPGVTRDRLYAESEWLGRKFNIVDTGGIEPSTDSEILSFMREQAQIAIDSATVTILVTDLRTGVTASDKEIANMLLKSRRPVVLAVNKADSVGPTAPAVYEFYELGLGDPIDISAIHGHNVDTLLDACFEYFPQETEDGEDEDRIKVAVIGKPNVGKSSLINCILGEKRVIVSDVAGTTRDAVDTEFDNDSGKYVFIDTAGIRRHSKVEERIEKFSVMRAKLAVERADVCLIMIDARDGVTEQDTKIAGLAHEAGKASIIAVNKWDLVDKETGTMEKMRKDIMRDLSFMSYAPIIFISALTGQRTNRLFDLINFVNDQNSMRITTGLLNNVLSDAQARVQPPTDKGRRLKIYYMTQTGIKPPNFVIFCNSRELFHFSYQRYIENQIRSVFGLEGTPLRMVIRQKGDSE